MAVSTASFSIAMPIVCQRLAPLPPRRGERRQEDEHEHGDDVFHDEPADRGVSFRRIDAAVIHQRAQQARRCWRPKPRCQESSPVCHVQPTATARPVQASVAAVLCPSAPGTAIERTASRSFKLKVQADAEHQQDHADLRELGRDLRVADKPRRVRADQHARDEIADDRRKPKRFASNPKSNAALSASAIVVIKGMSCMVGAAVANT